MKKYAAITKCPHCGNLDKQFPKELILVEELFEDESTKCPHCGAFHSKEYICMADVSYENEEKLQSILALFTTEQLEAELKRRGR